MKKDLSKVSEWIPWTIGGASEKFQREKHRSASRARRPLLTARIGESWPETLKTRLLHKHRDRLTIWDRIPGSHPLTIATPPALKKNTDTASFSEAQKRGEKTGLGYTREGCGLLLGGGSTYRHLREYNEVRKQAKRDRKNEA